MVHARDDDGAFMARPVLALSQGGDCIAREAECSVTIEDYRVAVGAQWVWPCFGLARHGAIPAIIRSRRDFRQSQQFTLSRPTHRNLHIAEQLGCSQSRRMTACNDRCDDVGCEER